MRHKTRKNREEKEELDGSWTHEEAGAVVATQYVKDPVNQLKMLKD